MFGDVCQKRAWNDPDAVGDRDAYEKSALHGAAWVVAVRIQCGGDPMGTPITSPKEAPWAFVSEVAMRTSCRFRHQKEESVGA